MTHMAPASQSQHHPTTASMRTAGLNVSMLYFMKQTADPYPPGVQRRTRTTLWATIEGRQVFSSVLVEHEKNLSALNPGDLLNWIQEWGPIVTTHDIIAYLMQELYPEGMYPMGSASQHQLPPADVSEPNNQGVPYETATVAPPGPLIGSLQQGESSRSNELQGNDQGDDMVIDFHNGEGHTQYVNQSHPINEHPSSKFNLGRKMKVE